jgi:hypothetical protein
MRIKSKQRCRSLLPALLGATVLLGSCVNQEGNPTCDSTDALCAHAKCATCDPPGTDVRELAFAVVPTNSSPFLPQRVSMRPVELGNPVHIGLESSIQIVGSITFAGSASPGPSGVLSFQRSYHSTTHMQQVRVDRGLSYSAFVLPGQYDVALLPDEPTIPGMVWRDIDLTLDTDPKLTIPSPSNLLNLNGTISHNIGTDESYGVQRVHQAKVVALNRETRVSSSVALTDSEGTFALSFLPDSGVYDLWITRSEDEAVIPDVVLEDVIECDANQCRNLLESETSNSQIVAVSLGTYSTDIQSSSLQLKSESPEKPIDWSGTVVEFSRDLGLGQLRVRAQVADDGRVAGNLPPGTYQVHVRTTSDSPAATHSSVISLEGDNATLLLPIRQRLQGVIRDASGERVDRARVEFEAQGLVNDVLASSPTVSTDEEGRFSAWLDAVPYQMTIVPLDPGLPWAIIALDSLEKDQERTFTLAAGRLVRGTILGQGRGADAGWDPVPDASIQVLEKIDGLSVRIGEGLTDGQGAFQIILPSDDSNN